ncbi:unnamed protein product [Sphagnum troendelagicum]|uniref:Transmembrane protein n=1 Tax=Sphagnum troendelagicum TaxID=128251 RepID=A0ABP0TU61_9BRYO
MWKWVSFRLHLHRQKTPGKVHYYFAGRSSRSSRHLVGANWNSSLERSPQRPILPCPIGDPFVAQLQTRWMQFALFVPYTSTGAGLLGFVFYVLMHPAFPGASSKRSPRFCLDLFSDARQLVRTHSSGSGPGGPHCDFRVSSNAAIESRI